MLLSKSWLVFWASCFLFTRVTLPFANIRNKGGMCQYPIRATPAHLRSQGNHFDDLWALEVDGNTRGVPSETTRCATGWPGRDTQTEASCLEGSPIFGVFLKDLLLNLTTSRWINESSNKTMQKPWIFNQPPQGCQSDLHRCTWHTSAFWSFVPLLKIRIKGIKGCQSLRCLGRRSFWAENLWTFFESRVQFWNFVRVCLIWGWTT